MLAVFGVGGASSFMVIPPSGSRAIVTASSEVPKSSPPELAAPEPQAAIASLVPSDSVITSEPLFSAGRPS